MKKICNIFYKLFLCVTLFATFQISYVYAASPITGTWYSTANSGGYWESQPDIFLTQLSTDSTSSENIGSVLTAAVNQWKTAGIPSAITTSPSGAEIKYYGGTRAELNATGNFNYTETIYGQTYYASITSAGTTTLNSYTTINLNKYNLVYSSTATNGEYAMGVTLHELGHALGWEGHSSSTDVIMSQEPNGLTALTDSDATHLRQIYNAVQ